MKKLITTIILIITIAINLYSQKIDYSKSYATVYEQLMEAKMYKECIDYFDKKLNEELLKANNEDEIQTEIIDKTNHIVRFFRYNNTQKIIIDTAQGEYAEYAKYMYILDSVTVSDYYSDIAAAKNKLKKHNNAINDYKKALQYLTLKDSISIYQTYNKIAKIYWKGLHDKDTAFKYYQKAYLTMPAGIVDFVIFCNKVNKQTEALTILNKQPYSNSDVYYYWRGVIWENQKKYDKAISDYQKCQELEINNGRGYQGISGVYKEQDKFGKAHEYIDKAIKLDPDSIDFRVTKSRIYTKEKKHDLAISTMDKAVNINSQDADTYYWRAVAKEKAKKYDEAIADYKKCQELEQIKGRGYAGIATVYKEQKNYEKAHEYIDKAIKLEPKYIDYLSIKSRVYTAQKKHNLAISTMDKAVNLNPQDADAYYWRAVAKEKAKKYDEAIADYKKCKELEQIKGRGYAGIATVYKEQDKFEKALEYINKAIEKEPQKEYFIYTKAGIQEAIGELNKSISNYLIYEKKKKNGFGYYGVAYINFYTGKLNEAETYINKAIQNDKQNNSFYNLKSNIFGEKKDYNNAILYSEKSLELSTTQIGKGVSYTYISIYNISLANEIDAKKAGKLARDGETFMMIKTATNHTDEFNNQLVLWANNKNPYYDLYISYFSSKCSIIDDLLDGAEIEKMQKTMETLQIAYKRALNQLPSIN